MLGGPCGHWCAPKRESRLESMVYSRPVGTVRARSSRALLAVVGLLLLVLIPAVDQAVFGLHGHVAVAGQDGDIASPDGFAGALPGHHCELSASGADVVGPIAFPVVAMPAVQAPGLVLGALQHRTLVLFTPPRA